MKAKILDLDKPNANGRIYPKEVMENAIKKYKEDMIDKKRALIGSELTGPELNIEKAYGLVDDIYIEDDSVFIEFHPLQLPICEILTPLVESKKLHFATCGVVAKMENNIVGDDYELRYTFLTDDPSYDY
jgi:hypothetical protein